MIETSAFTAACAVLGLSAAPSWSDARSAFRVRAALLHPDVHQSAGADRMSAATVAMQQLNDAYQLVLESLAAADRDPESATDRHTGVTRHCPRCRSESQYAATGRLACPRCGHGFRGTTRNVRTYSPSAPRAGRVVVSSRRRRAPQPARPTGRLSHVASWYGAS
jgi:hypothetical protein